MQQHERRRVFFPWALRENRQSFWPSESCMRPCAKLLERVSSVPASDCPSALSSLQIKKACFFCKNWSIGVLPLYNKHLFDGFLNCLCCSSTTASNNNGTRRSKVFHTSCVVPPACFAFLFLCDVATLRQWVAKSALFLSSILKKLRLTPICVLCEESVC